MSDVMTAARRYVLAEMAKVIVKSLRNCIAVIESEPMALAKLKQDPVGALTMIVDTIERRHVHGIHDVVTPVAQDGGQ